MDIRILEAIRHGEILMAPPHIGLVLGAEPASTLQQVRPAGLKETHEVRARSGINWHRDPVPTVQSPGPGEFGVQEVYQTDT